MADEKDQSNFLMTLSAKWCESCYRILNQGQLEVKAGGKSSM